MIEGDAQVFEEGDVVRFERASLPQTRERNYVITAVGFDYVEVSACGFDYRYRLADTDRLGMRIIRKRHATKES